ncbi:MAG: hypothetical protein Q7S79_03240 [bacterium]|nr:hypothetical protein [bacterium]
MLFSLSWKVYSGYKNRLWDNRTRFTIVVAKENPEVYSFEVATKTLVHFSIPKNTQIEASNKMGKWYVGSLWQLGKQKGLKGELLQKSIQKSFGIAVDAWVEDGGEELFESSALGKIGAIRKAIFTGTLKTNLTFFDRFNLLTALSGDIDIRALNLTASRVVVKTKLADGEEAYTVVPDQANAIFEKALRDDLVFSETKTLNVLNSAGKSGIGGEVTRVTQVLGVRVIGARASEEKFDGVCKIRGEKEALVTITALKIGKLYGCTSEVGQTVGPANLEMVLGSGFVEKF